MSNYLVSYKAFPLKDNYTVVCFYENTRYGFRHIASLQHENYEVAQAKVCYYNRRWESFEFETVINKVLEKIGKTYKEMKLQGD